MIQIGNSHDVLVKYLKNRHPEIAFIKLEHSEQQDDLEHLHQGLYQLSYATGGHGVVKIQSERLRSEPNTFYVINPNELHNLSADAGAFFQNATCRFKLPDFNGKLLRHKITLPEEEAVLGLGHFCTIQSLALKGDDHSLILANLELAKLLLLLSRYCKEEFDEKYSALIAKAIHFISENFRSNISIDSVAVACDVSASHLSRAFRKETGVTPLSLLQRIRLGYALERIFSTNMKISDIAMESGFENSKNLNLAFQRVYNMSAGAFRSKYRETNPLIEKKSE